MASKQESTRGSGTPLNLAVAALAAIALGFVTFAMPAEIFSGLIVQSGLPDLLTAAEPPLGMKARMIVVAAVSILSFASVMLLLGGIDRIGARPRRKPEIKLDEEAPRLRRADAHPDAPSRRPLLAGRELSEPFETDFAEEYPEESPREMFADLEPRPLPGFLQVAQEDVPSVEIESVEAPAEAFHEPETYEHAEDELVLDQPAGEDDIYALVAQLPDVPEEAGDDSITDLMRRLESGLASRELDQPVSENAEPVTDQDIQAEAPPAPVPVAEPEPDFAAHRLPDTPAVEAVPEQDLPPAEVSVGRRLRSAIDELQKVAGRAG